MTPNLQRYVDLLFKLEAVRKRRKGNPRDEDDLLDEMDTAWYALTTAEEDELERMWAEGSLPEQEGAEDK